MLVLLGFFLGVSVAWLLLRRASSKKPKFLSTNEYWVYLPGIEMPPQEEIMARLLRETVIPGAITPKEGLLLSDIRLHIALVLRSKNTHAFRPDLFSENTEPTAQLLQALSESRSFVKVRYISDTPLRDMASVQLLPHLAEVIAALGGGTAVYDSMTEELISAEDFRLRISSSRDLTSPAHQLRVLWKSDGIGGWGETRGLRKIGLPELKSAKVDFDEQVLVVQVLEEAADELWRVGSFQPALEVTAFGDRFQIELEQPRERVSNVRILRLQAS